MIAVYLASCARVRHEPLRRVRCSCGADHLDSAPPEHCPACGCGLSPLVAWSTPVIADGSAVTVVTCSAEACRAKAEDLARQEVERGRGVRLVDATDQQVRLYGYAVERRIVPGKE
jgi:hypothetical protein